MGGRRALEQGGVRVVGHRFSRETHDLRDFLARNRVVARDERGFILAGPDEGTGLGLDTARRIVVDRHGGSITVESEPGSTTFRIWLPIEE